MYANEIIDKKRPRRRQKNGIAFSLASFFQAPDIPFERADDGAFNAPVRVSVRRVPDELSALR